MSSCLAGAPDRLVSPSQPLLNIRKTPNIITRRLAQFRDHSITTRETNHLMLALTSSEMRVGQAWLGNNKLEIFLSGHGSLSSLASLGQGSASFISEEKTNFEIQKLRQELQEEHQKCKRLQSQLSTNVRLKSRANPSLFFHHYTTYRLTLFPHSSIPWPI